MYCKEFNVLFVTTDSHGEVLASRYLRGKVSDGKVFVSCISSLSERCIVVIAGRTYTELRISA